MKPFKDTGGNANKRNDTPCVSAHVFVSNNNHFEKR